MKIFIGCDHAAFDEKDQVKLYLLELGHEVVDCGTDSNERCNYPTFASRVARKVGNNEGKGILLCGSGIGVSMVANRYQNVRAALCRTEQEAELARQHNDSNVLCVGARLTTMEAIKKIIDAWLAASFEEGRHTDRIKMFNQLGESLDTEIRI